MGKILSVKEAIKRAEELKDKNASIVLAGGCFDILHVGHVQLLKEAKKYGDYLMVVLESDESMKQKKGTNRPIFNQHDRAEVVSAITFVDYVILLPSVMSDLDYDNLINSLKPTIIATTKGDPNRHHKERQTKAIGGRVIDVIKQISEKSTTQIAMLLSKEL